MIGPVESKRIHLARAEPKSTDCIQGHVVLQSQSSLVEFVFRHDLSQRSRESGKRWLPERRKNSAYTVGLLKT